MNALVLRAALRATARIACTAVIVGCGGTVYEGNGEAAKGDGSTREGSSTKNGPMCNAPPPSTLFDAGASPGSVTESMWSCCVEGLEPLIGGELGISDAAAMSPDVVACCGVVLYARTYIDDDSGDPALRQDFEDISWNCCSTVAGESFQRRDWLGCAGWGPPMPPAVPGEALVS
jgi:hypothetical protein